MSDKFRGTAWIPGDTLLAADLLDTFDEIRFTSVAGTTAVTGFILHSNATWSAKKSDYIYQTTDSGLNWVVKNSSFSSGGEEAFLVKCKTDSTLGVAVETKTSGGTNKTAFTNDSGATWTNKTVATFGTEIYAVDFPISSRIIVGGDDSVGTKHVIFSVDSGATWTDSTTSPSAFIVSLDMFDGTTGYALDTNGLIWKTVNSAVDWTTTGHTTTTKEQRTELFCLSATSVIIAGEANIITYNNSTGALDIRVKPQNATPSNIVKSTNGDVYVVYFSTSDVTPALLYRSKDSGVSWEVANTPSNHVIGADLPQNQKTILDEHTAEKFYILGGNGSLVKFDSRKMS